MSASVCIEFDRLRLSIDHKITKSLLTPFTSVTSAAHTRLTTPLIVCCHINSTDLKKQKHSQMWMEKKSSTNLFHNYEISNLNTAAFNLHCS